MREFPVAAGVVESVLEFTEAHAGAIVIKVRIAIGAASGLDPEQFWLCYQAITEDTSLAGSQLEIEYCSVTIKCRVCGYSGPPQLWEGFRGSPPTLLCSLCGEEVEDPTEPECAIKAIQVRQASSASHH